MDQQQPPPDYLKEHRENQIRQAIQWQREFSDLWMVRTATVQFPPAVAQLLYDQFLTLAEGLVAQLPTSDPQP